ncbi:hypothetical protein SAMN05661107_2131 [Maritimibacter sp. HL-12]|nr:hypothetical protein SAMN05661107_2131 [Maritimibacter sp. HL-12]
MRMLLSLALAALVPGFALADEAMCEYRHPDRPSWDFFAACEIEETSRNGVATLEANVANGSRFTIEDPSGADGLAAVSVNGLAATRLAREDARCYLTETEGELVCIHPQGSVASTTAPPEPSPAPAASDTGFGGGQRGFCLLAARKDGVETLVEYGACTRRENCLASDTGGLTCLTDFNWTSGRLTEMARADDWRTLDGATVDIDDKGCFNDAPGGLRFCFSQDAMTAAEHPVLATASP